MAIALSRKPRKNSENSGSDYYLNAGSVIVEFWYDYRMFSTGALEPTAKFGGFVSAGVQPGGY